MVDFEVGNVDRKFNIWGGFRDEMVATAMTLSLVVVGSFVVMERVINKPAAAETAEAVTVAESNPQTLGAQDNNSGEEAGISDTDSTATPTPVPYDLAEVVYGEDGEYDFEGYWIAFTNPRLQFDGKTNTKRKIFVTIKIKNKHSAESLPIKLVASIIKDGVIIVPEAALYIPGSRIIGPNEEVVFDASLPLVEATDVRELKFKPGNGIAEASHFLYP